MKKINNLLIGIMLLIIATSLVGANTDESSVQTSSSDGFVIANDIQQARADIENAGGNVRHIFFDDKVLIGKIPSGLKSKYIDAVYSSDDSVPEKYSTEFNAWKSVLEWNTLSVEDKMKDTPKDAQPLINDVEYSIDVKKLDLNVANKAMPSGATATDTSLYMLGDIAVTVIMPESSVNSPNTENWNESENAIVIAETMAALDWWMARNPDAPITFVYSFKTNIPVDYEPITMATTRIARCSWINQSLVYLSNVPMTSATFLDCDSKIYDYTNIQRNNMNTDWSFLIFMADSSNDVDGLFPDWINAKVISTLYGDGIYVIGNYKNNIHGPEKLDATIAHEIGHIFGAADQYGVTGVCSTTINCGYRTGYLYYNNNNCIYCPGGGQPSIMLGVWEEFEIGALDQYARGQIGWQDSNSDGVEDLLGIFNTTLINYNIISSINNTNSSNVSVNGSANIAMYPAVNTNYHTVSINRINNVTYSLDQTNWFYSVAKDGSFNSLNETYKFLHGPLSWNNYVFKSKIVDRFNSNIPSTTYGSISVNITGCVDGDNGQNYKVKANITNFNGTNYGNQIDYCVNTRTLKEYYCNGINISSVESFCLYGCWDGRCVDKSIPRNLYPAIAPDGIDRSQ